MCTFWGRSSKFGVHRPTKQNSCLYLQALNARNFDPLCRFLTLRDFLLENSPDCFSCEHDASKWLSHSLRHTTPFRRWYVNGKRVYQVTQGWQLRWSTNATSSSQFGGSALSLATDNQGKWIIFVSVSSVPCLLLSVYSTKLTHVLLTSVLTML